MMVKIMSDFKRIKGKVHFHVSGLAGAVHDDNIEGAFELKGEKLNGQRKRSEQKIEKTTGFCPDNFSYT